jgi:F-type H+-transporting ATPase subunit epsilon
MSSFNLNIFTPNGIVLKGLECESFIVPTINGEINVLPGHINLISELATGVLTAKTGMGNRNFSMTAGLLKVIGNEVNVLSTTSEDSDNIDIERAKSAKAKAESRLKSDQVLDTVQMVKFKRKLERASMRIRLANLK